MHVAAVLLVRGGGRDGPPHGQVRATSAPTAKAAAASHSQVGTARQTLIVSSRFMR
jgi:hypothetical protein